MTPNQSLSGGNFGPIAGIIVIVLMLTLGALYFTLARSQRAPESLPLIQGDTSTSSSPYTPQ